jgi:hypothetical protein
MTFCFAVKVKEALVGIADTRVTTGTQHVTARKLAIYQHGRHSLFLMTSGLRSARDKALTYFEEVLEQGDSAFDRLYKARRSTRSPRRCGASLRKTRRRWLRQGCRSTCTSSLAGNWKPQRAQVISFVSPGELGGGGRGNPLLPHRRIELWQTDPRSPAGIPVEHGARA